MVVFSSGTVVTARGRNKDEHQKGAKNLFFSPTLQALTQADSGEGSGFVDDADSESAFSSRVRIGTTLTVACPWDRGRLPDGWTSPSVFDALLSAQKFCRSEQSVALVTPGSCVAKTIFVKVVDG